MKNYYLLLTLFIISITVHAQEVDISPEFLLSKKNLRLSVDLGMDLNWADKKGESSLMKFNGETTGENIKFNTIPNVAAGIGFDIYSPNSILGFYFGANFQRHIFGMHNSFNQVIDSVNTENIEIPVYLKFRFGKVKSKGHLWVAVGGGYSLPITTKIKSFNNSINIYESEDEKLYKGTPFLSTILGYEFLLGTGTSSKEMYDRDNFRILIYAKGNYDLSNRVNQDWQFNKLTSLSKVNNLDIQYTQITFGIRVLMRLSKLGEITSEALIQQLNNN